MAYDFKILKDGLKANEDWLKKEYAGIRTGRATPTLLDSIQVEAYGSYMPISQVASMSVEGPRTLRITPWDASQNKSIEKAIVASDIGVSVATDEKGLRISFPELTTDRRVMLVKLAKQKLEDAKVVTRSEREKVIKDLEKKQTDGQISEDEKFRLKTELQKYVDDAGSLFDEMFKKKELEINE